MKIAEIRKKLDAIDKIEDKSLQSKRLGSLGFALLVEYTRKLSDEDKSEVIEELCDAIDYNSNYFNEVYDI